MFKWVIMSGLVCVNDSSKKRYKMNWTEEIFQIVNRLPRTPVVYEVCDLLERLIECTFCEKELQKLKHPDISCRKSTGGTNKK